MAKTRYEANLTYSFTKGDVITVKAGIDIYSFSVTGGANRKIDLNSTDEMNIGSEMEQAKNLKNINFFLLPSQGLVINDMGEYYSNKTPISIDFVVSVYVGKVMTKSLELNSETSAITTHPWKTGSDKKPLIIVETSIPDAKLKYTSRKSKNNIVEEDW